MFWNGSAEKSLHKKIGNIVKIGESLVTALIVDEFSNRFCASLNVKFRYFLNAWYWESIKIFDLFFLVTTQDYWIDSVAFYDGQFYSAYLQVAFVIGFLNSKGKMNLLVTHGRLGLDLNNNTRQASIVFINAIVVHCAFLLV